MEQNIKNNEFNDPYFSEIQSKIKFSFDFVLWFYRILKYWYLFVISLILFLGYAYLKNKSWIPQYTTSGLVMIERRFNNVGVSTTAVTYGSMINSSINQEIILTSREMVARTVDKLPQLQVRYFIKTKFKETNIYGYTPVVVECNYIAPSAHGYVFNIEPIDSEKCRIFYEGTEDYPPFSMVVQYGQFVKEPRFFIRVKKTERFTQNFQPFSFRFLSKQQIMNLYYGRIQTGRVAEGSAALRVWVSGDNLNQNVEFLDALLTEFSNYNLLMKNEAADNTISFIDKQLIIISDSLNSSEETLRVFQDETGMYKPEYEDNRQRLNQIAVNTGENQAKERSVLILSELINNAIANNTEVIDPTTIIGTGGVAVNNSKLSAYIEEYNKMVVSMRYVGEANPIYDRLTKDLNGLKINILEGVKGMLAQIKQEKDDLEIETVNIESKMIDLPAKERQFLRYERNYKVNESYNTYLLQKRYEASIQKASNLPDNYVLERPRIEGGAINAGDKTDTYIFYFLIGLALPLAFVICKEEFFNFSISTKEECERISGLPVIGTIENVSSKMAGGLFLVKNFPKSSYAESFRNMRIRIEYVAQREFPTSILVTSSEPADGKTFVAANMASIYQLTGKKVVLLDFDLRRPSVSKNLGIHSKKGVSNYLIGQVTLDEIIVTHPDYGFDVIPAGTLPPNPSELIKNKKTKDLISYLKTHYDHLIIDCSPIGLVSDAYILSRFVDANLFVVRRGKTNKAFFKSVMTQIHDDGLEHFVIVFNDVKGREGYYGTSRYYGDKSYYLKRNSYYHDDYFEK